MTDNILMINLRTAAQILKIPENLCTVTGRGTLVPWLAAKGPYSYTPENAPRVSRLFDYGQIMPSVFTAPGRYSFGINDSRTNDRSFEIYQDFWDAAKDGRVTPVFKAEGKRTEDGFEAPIAVYKFSRFDHAHYAVIQNGSYQFLFAEEHPEIENGAIRLYRGTVYEEITLDRGSRESYERRMDFTAGTFLSSAWAFAYAHRYVQKRRTHHIIGMSRQLRGIYASCESLIVGGLLVSDLDIDTICFSTIHRQAEVFGPNVISLETPLTNIRISSGYLSEFEAKLIDPEKITMK
jgi:hypothetical protein